MDKTADKKSMKKAYHKKALKFHPDKNNSKSEEEKEKFSEIFKEVKEAYNVLVVHIEKY